MYEYFEQKYHRDLTNSFAGSFMCKQAFMILRGQHATLQILLWHKTIGNNDHNKRLHFNVSRNKLCNWKPIKKKSDSFFFSFDQPLKRHHETDINQEIKGFKRRIDIMFPRKNEYVFISAQTAFTTAEALLSYGESGLFFGKAEFNFGETNSMKLFLSNQN